MIAEFALSARFGPPMRKPALPILHDPALLRTIARVWVALAGAFCLFDMVQKLSVGWTDGHGRPIGDDFVNYFSGAWLALHQRAAEIYHWPAYHAFQEQLVGAAVSPNYNYSYPPVLLALTLPFAALPYLPALGAWLIGGWFAFYRSLRLAVPGKHALLFALATPAVFINTYTGQNGVWTAAFLGGGLCLLERRPVLAGMLFGLQVYKPHLALMIPVALIAGRQWRAFVSAGVTATALVLASVLLVGWDGWRGFLDVIPILRKMTLEDADAVWHQSASVFMAVHRLGLSLSAAYAAQAAAALLAAALVALAWFKDAAVPARNAAMVIGALLATPYLQVYDLVVGAFVVAWLTNWKGATKPGTQIASALILVLPLAATPLAKLTGLAFGPLFIIPALIVTARMILTALPAYRVAQPSATRP